MLFTSSKVVGRCDYGFISLGWSCHLFLYIWQLQEYPSGLDQSSFVASDYLISFGCRVLCMLPRVDYWSSFVVCDYVIGVAFGSIMLCILPRVE